MPQLSVIIPTFNRVQVLEKALNSVVAQTYQDWELLIVDDGSTDGTAEFVRAWIGERKNIRLFITANRGVGAARNFAVKNALSPWVAFLDSDDEWLPEKLEMQMALTPYFTLIHSEEIWIRNGVRVNPMKKYQKSGGEIFERCVEHCCVSPSTTVLKRSTFNEFGGFREDFPVCEDYELWLRWTRKFAVGFIETPLIKKFGGHADQLSLTHRAMDYYRVKALMPFVNESHVAQTIHKKCEILIKGYHKHGNLIHLAEVEGYRAAALNFLTQNQSAHSVTDLRPRSVAKLSL